MSAGQIAALIAEVLSNIESEDVAASVRRRVQGLTEKFPLYHWKLDTIRA